MITFSIPGTPVAKGRPRFARVGRGRGMRVYTLEKTENYEHTVAWIAKRAMLGHKPLDGPLVLVIMVFAPVPKSFSRAKREAALQVKILPVSRPDWNNYGKLISDACNGIVWKDDAQVVDARVVKRYGITPCCVVSVEGV